MNDHLVIILFVSVLVALTNIRPAYSQIALIKWHVYVKNEMSQYGPILHVHCKSKDNDLGLQNLTAGAEFEWHFKLNFTGSTLFWCYWRPEKGNIYADFKVFWKDRELFEKCNYKNCIWIARDTGLYLRNVPKDYDEFWYHWTPGSMDTYLHP
ncbi:hypothetical protein Dsin_022325 [Dipteronia sinensis]|uniref:S-protein homolog n=1 Tax=Dipteronia sinensis TaxID=43782 RepID=A0AAE0DZN7_9ROSI|nr:hypothetical protein Dsin_022323 [Dipteronia sinensis]KAK3198910.1 hypothetical protein Dsin_022325 [Dipteronia sinensis]